MQLFPESNNTHLFGMTFNEHSFDPQSVSHTYKASTHYSKWLTKWNEACNSIKKFTALWKNHWEGKTTLVGKMLVLVERKLKILFATRDKCEVKIREEQPAI